MFRFLRVFVGLSFSLIASQALADAFCVSSAADFRVALETARSDGADDYIKVAVGNYDFSTPLDVYVADGHGLTIEGGYSDCNGGSVVPVPDNTIFAGATHSYFRLRVYSGGLTVRNLTFTKFSPPIGTGTHAIQLADYGASDVLRVSKIDVSNNAVTDANAAALELNTNGGLIFHDSIAHDNANVAPAVMVDSEYANGSVTVANNTIVKNAGPGILFNVYSWTPAALYNNIFWGNGSADLIMGGVDQSMPPLALNNTWKTCPNCTSLYLAQGSANDSQDPLLSTTAPKYRLGTSSPAINTGLPVPMVLDATDAANSVRVQGSAPDRGAYESATDDFSISHSFNVMSTSDSATDLFSLRHAITTANAAGAPARIYFSLPDCAQAIMLDAPLPPIKVPMLIDGYANAAQPNTAAALGSGAIPFNATLCVRVIGSLSSSQVANALSVDASADPSVHVEIRGLRFINFGTAVELDGGNGHWIHGNAFALKLAHGVLGNGRAIAVAGGFADVIGGQQAADVNLIGASSDYGVYLSNDSGQTLAHSGFHVVANNNIGAEPTGSTDNTFKNSSSGVALSRTSRMTVSGNWIVANGGDGIVVDNSAYDLIQSNFIGSDIAPGYGNTGAGIHVRNASGYNWFGATSIGTPQRNIAMNGGNTIASNGGAGVIIDSDASTENQVEANSIFGNGGLAIDLDQPGPTANSGDESAGPNRLLHKPILKSAEWDSDVGSVVLKGNFTTAANAGTNISVYASRRCGGDAQVWLGKYAVQSDAAGTVNFMAFLPSLPFESAYLTAVTQDSMGISNTSELSSGKFAPGNDAVFVDGFDCR